MRLLESRSRWISSRSRKCIITYGAVLTVLRNGSNWWPEPFKVKFTPRDAVIKRTIEKEGEEALENLAKYERETKYRFSTFAH
jgi:hypothetical protein